jgi:hypothetical protein
MAKLEDIKLQVGSLSANERAKLLEWLSALDHADWDDQIARDLIARKLDALIAEAQAD